MWFRYGNNVANISSLQSHKAGKYNVRFAENCFGLQTSLSATDKADNVVGHVDFPTAYGICFVRIAVIPDEVDQTLANEYQHKLCVREIVRPSGAIAPPLPLRLFRSPGYYPTASVTLTQAVLSLTALLAQYNPPIVLQDRKWVSETLYRSGIYSDVVRKSSAIEDSEMRNFAESQSRRLLASPGGKLNHGNGWSSSYPDCLGLFYSNYAARYYVAKRGYLGLTKDQAIYPSLPGPLAIEGNKAILVQFSRRPVLSEGGFWSLTAYDDQQYLVPNELRRYCLGDRDEMTFPDQTPLADGRKDGKFYILLQAANNPPPSGWRSNWLPTPARGGTMSVTLRWYGAMEEMLNGTYEYPKLIHMDAINESNHPKL